jgi:hypothetical protein
MKNTITTTIIGLIILSVTMGCGLASRVQKTVSGSPDSNTANPHDKSLTDKGIDIATGNQRIGVQECDDLMDDIEQQSQSNDDNYVTRAMKGYILNKVRESVKTNIEENKNDKVKMAKECKDFQVQLDKQLADEKAKK